MLGCLQSVLSIIVSVSCTGLRAEHSSSSSSQTTGLLSSSLQASSVGPHTHHGQVTHTHTEVSPRPKLLVLTLQYAHSQKQQTRLNV